MIRMVTPTLHVGTRCDVDALDHVALVYLAEAGEAAEAIDAGRRVVVPSEEVAQQVLKLRGIDPDTLPNWDIIRPGEGIPPAP